jgi:hypothetical protein
MKQITAMLTGGTYADNVKEVRLGSLCVSGKQKALCLSRNQQDTGRTKWKTHHGETIRMILCPDRPSPAR